MMIVCAALTAKPGRGDELESILRSLFPHVRREHGVVNYILHRDPENTERLFFYERYQSVSVKEAHMQTDYLRDTLRRAEPLLAAPPQVDVYEDVEEIGSANEEPGFSNYEHNGKTVWCRADLQERQKEFCLCWSCRKFAPGTPDKGCPIIQSVLKLADEKGVVLPVWACPEFTALESRASHTQAPGT